MHASPHHKNSHSGTGSWFWRLNFAFARLTDQHIPHELLGDPETARRARLITHFGVLGAIFGGFYTAFYLLIGHNYGAAIVAACTLGVAFTPFLMRWTHGTAWAGNFFSLVLVLGFFGLCLCEGGLFGHAIAWLVSVPLCAMLLIGIDGALKWTVLSLGTAGVVAGLSLAGIDVQPTYEARYHVLISTAGYVGLIAFMAILGFIFERGRIRAQARMHEALQRLAESNQKLVAMNQEKNEFLSIAAHDLKNPLTSILVNSDLMRHAGDPRQTKYADKIVAAAETMRHLITDLLDVDAIEEGRFASKSEPCDLSSLVHDCIEANLPNATHKQIEVEANELDLLVVLTDRTAARQILDNLISNAVKYSPRGSTVNVDLLVMGGAAMIRVRDRGPGLSDEDQRNLFKKFCRLSAKPTGGESSNGLGLAIAHRLAKALLGGIRCESTLGEGSTFIFELPLPPTGSVVVPKSEILEKPMRIRTTSKLPEITLEPGREPEPVPDTPPPGATMPMPVATAAAIAMPPPPRHRVPAPPGPIAKKS
jgi:signal transduction histidine kinase